MAVVQPFNQASNNTNTGYNSVTIGGKTYDKSYVDNPNNQEAIRQAVVGGGGVQYTNSSGNSYDNTSNNMTAAAPVIAPPTAYDPTADITALGTARKNAAVIDLGNARDKSLADLSVANGKIEPAYYTQRNNVSTNSQVGAKNFAEFLSQRGQNNAVGNSGTMGQSEISSNVALQGNLGGLATAQASDYAENARLVGNTNVDYNNGVASSNANIDASNMQSLIDAKQNYSAQQLAQANADRDYNYGVGRDTITDTGKNADGTYTQQGQSNATAQELQVAQLKEITDPNSTTNQMNKLGLDTAKLNFAALPAQLKAQAQQTAVDFQKGVIDIRTAQQQLNNLPALLKAQQQALELSNKGQAISNQYAPGLAQAQINASNASTNASNIDSYGNSFNGSSGGGGTEISVGGGVPVAYTDFVNGAAKQYGVDPTLLAGLLQVESGFDVNAHNDSSGADGMAQFLASTAKEQGVDTNDAKSSIYGAAKYLALRIKQAGSVSGGVMGYGEGTTAYLNKVIAAQKNIVKANTAAAKVAKAQSDKEFNAANAAAKKAATTKAALKAAQDAEAYNKNHRGGVTY